MAFPKRSLSIVGCVLFHAPAIFAQLQATPSFDRDSILMTYSVSSMLPFRTVTGSPYSGTQSMESLRTLPDGTHLTGGGPIDTTTWRDSLGRVRIAKPVIGSGPKGPVESVIEVHDPVSGYSWVLDDQQRIAHRIPLKAIPAPPAPATLPARPASTNTLSDGVIGERVPLGTRNIGGVEAIGMKTSLTYPAGSQMGNDKPVTSVNESWYSPKLGATVLSRNSNPGMGETTSTLKDLKLTEPDAALFLVPSDYKVVDETGPFSISVPRKK